MRVMVDAELLRGGHAGDCTMVGLLVGFLTCEGIAYWRYSDESPRLGGAWRVTSAGERVPVGWVVTEASHENTDSYSVAWAVGDHAFRTALAGEPSLFAKHDRRTRAYDSLGPDQALARRIADAVAACAARQVTADLYITERPYLHHTKLPTAQGVTGAADVRAGAQVDIAGGQAGEFGGAQPGLAGQHEQGVVAPPGPGGRVGGGQQRGDLLFGEVGDQGLVEALGRDRQHPGDYRGVFRMVQRGVPEQRVDGRQPGVAARRQQP
jgi:hypothetical protein